MCADDLEVGRVLQKGFRFGGEEFARVVIVQMGKTSGQAALELLKYIISRDEADLTLEASLLSLDLLGESGRIELSFEAF